MKFLFVDEFKNYKKKHKFYGLASVLIDNSSYARFKKGFYDKLKKLGWDKKIEIKGCYSFSATKGDTKVSVEDRLKFIENVFELSKSGSSKYASAKVYYTFNIFPPSTTEVYMYSTLLNKILGKIPKGSKKGNKNGKNNIVIFLDSNNDLDIKFISSEAERVLLAKNLFLVERCVNFRSSNTTPGILFADYVAYFIGNYFKTGLFNYSNIKRIQELVNKFVHGNISDREMEELKRFAISLEKERKSKNLLRALKTMIYVK